MSNLSPAQLNPTYVVTLDLTKTLAEMIKAGAYAYANFDINEKNFPMRRPEARVDSAYLTSPPEISLELIHYNQVMMTQEVKADFARRGLVPGELAHLLALCMHPQYKDLQRQFSLIALGSSWVDPDGYRRVPCLDGLGGGRYLYLRRVVPGYGWDGDCRFVAVRK